MKKIKLIGGFCYVLSFFFAAFLFADFNIGLTKSTTISIFLLLGAMAFTLNLISYSKDKTGNPLSNLTYWLGSFGVFAGLVFKMLGFSMLLGFPFSNSLIITGSLLLFCSVFYLRNRKSKKEDGEETLDQF
jgi:hypothetical protein